MLGLFLLGAGAVIGGVIAGPIGSLLGIIIILMLFGNRSL